MFYELSRHNFSFKHLKIPSVCFSFRSSTVTARIFVETKRKHELQSAKVYSNITKTQFCVFCDFFGFSSTNRLGQNVSKI